MAGSDLGVESEARQQVEYYFSHANWVRDEYLRGLADAEGFVALADLEDFPKLAAMLGRAGEASGDVLVRAVSASPLLDFDGERCAVRAANLGGSETHRAVHLVLDANALIRGRAASLAGYAERFWTIEEVLAEVRDSKSREALLSLPFELEVRSPSPEAMRRILDFAKLTGDLRSLSAVDAKVLALALTLELEAVGSDAHLRARPEACRGEKAAAAEDEADEAPEEAPEEEAPEESPPPAHREQLPPAPPYVAPASWAAALKAPPPPPRPAAAAAAPTPDAAAADEEAADEPAEAPEVEAEAAAEAAAPAPAAPAWSGPAPSRILSGPTASGAAAMAADDDDGVGWLDESHVAMGLATGAMPFGDAPPENGPTAKAYEPSCGCACATVDFAMQNVLLQMGLRLVSLDGMLVHRTTKWALRCAACFHVEDDQTKLFCARCGSTPLNRVAVGVDAATGERRVFLRKQKRNDLRGTKFALPKPGHADRYEGELLLREDQLLSGIWRQKAQRAKSAKTKRSIFGGEVTDSLEALNIVQTNDLVVGVGRKNPNATKGRERRGKAKRKH